MTPERFEEIQQLEKKWVNRKGSKWAELYTDIDCSQGEKRRELLAKAAKAIGVPADEFREWYNEMIDQATAFDVPPEEKSEDELRNIVFDGNPLS